MKMCLSWMRQARAVVGPSFPDLDERSALVLRYRRPDRLALVELGRWAGRRLHAELGTTSILLVAH